MSIDLLTRMMPLFRRMLDTYHHSKSEIEKFRETRPILTSLLWLWLRNDYQLSQAKHTEAGRLQGLFDGSEPLPSPVFFSYRTASAMSNSSEGMQLTAKRIASTPHAGYFTKAIKERGIDRFLAVLKTEKLDLEKLRKEHKEHDAGQFDGILAAMCASVHFMIRFYNKIVINMLVDVDSIDDASDAFLRWFDMVAWFLCQYAFDRELAIFSADSKKGHKIDDEYYLNTGAHKLDPEFREKLFQDLYQELYLLAMRYTQFRILDAKMCKPDMPLSAEQQRILLLRFNDLSFISKPRKVAATVKPLYMDLITVIGYIRSEFQFLNARLDPPFADQALVLQAVAALKILDLPRPSYPPIAATYIVQQTEAEVRVKEALALQQQQDPFPGAEIESLATDATIGALVRPETPDFAADAVESDVDLGSDPLPRRAVSTSEVSCRKVSINGFSTPQPPPTFVRANSDSRKRPGTPL